MYKVFFFDLDGTIIDSEQIGLEALQETLKEKGIIKDLEALRFSLGIPGLKTLEVLQIADIPTTLEAWAEKEKPLMKNVPLFTGVMEVISQLPRTGIVTSQTGNEMHNGFYQLQIAQHFQSIVCADDTKQYKPHPDPLLFALKQMQCTPDEAIFIGDSVYDMQCALSAGVDFGLALWGARTKEGFESSTYIFDTPADILQIC